jgi:hypothetical protein
MTDRNPPSPEEQVRALYEHAERADFARVERSLLVVTADAAHIAPPGRGCADSRRRL